MAALLALFLGLSAAGAADEGCGAPGEEGSWERSLRDLKGLAVSRHAAVSPDGGISVTFAEQVWQLPGDRRFSEGETGPGIAIGSGRTGERVTLKPDAGKGEYVTPVLDALSPYTRWERISWVRQENYAARDPSCRCPSPGSPLTPVLLACGVSDSASPLCSYKLSWPASETGEEPVPRGARGRFLAVCARLYGRGKAAEVMPSLVPDPAAGEAADLAPELSRLRVSYYARTAVLESVEIAPASLKSWGKLDYVIRPAGRGVVTVDVLGGDGELLLEDAAAGAVLGAAIDPFRHPVIKLRARISCDPDDAEKRPALLSWRVTWKKLAERLKLSAASFRPGSGEKLRGIVCLEREGKLGVRVHDAKGNTVRMLARAWAPARAWAFSWDGRGASGAIVDPGEYFVTAVTAAGAGTRRVRVQ